MHQRELNEVDKLVIALQDKMSATLEMSRDAILEGISVPPKKMEEQKSKRKEKQKARDELIKKLSKAMKMADEYLEILDAVTKLGINIIRKRYPFLVEKSQFDDKYESDLWSDFIANKMYGVIMRFNDKKYERSFTAYVRQCLANYCQDRIRKYCIAAPVHDCAGGKNNGDNTIITEASDKHRGKCKFEWVPSIYGNDNADREILDKLEDHRTSQHETVEQKEEWAIWPDKLEQTLKVWSTVLDVIGTEVPSKLVFHCGKFLKYCGYDEKPLFEEWKSESLETVSANIEQKYSEKLNRQTSFMSTIDRTMTEKGKERDKFLEGRAKDFINTSYWQTKESLRKTTPRIIDNINQPNFFGQENALKFLLDEICKKERKIKKNVEGETHEH